MTLRQDNNRNNISNTFFGVLLRVTHSSKKSF